MVERRGHEREQGRHQSRRKGYVMIWTHDMVIIKATTSHTMGIQHVHTISTKIQQQQQQQQVRKRP